MQELVEVLSAARPGLLAENWRRILRERRVEGLEVSVVRFMREAVAVDHDVVSVGRGDRVAGLGTPCSVPDEA